DRGLAPGLLQLLADGAGQRVGGAAGGVGHHQLDRLRGIVLRQRRREQGSEAKRDERAAQRCRLHFSGLLEVDYFIASRTMLRAMMICWICVVPSYSRNRRTSR